MTSTVTALYAPPRCEARRRIEEVRAHRERGAEAVLLEVRYGDGATRWLRLPLTSGPEVRARRVADPAARAAAGEALPVCGLDEAKGRGGALVFQTSHPWVYQVRIPGQPEVRASIDRGRHPARYLTLPLFPVAVALDVGTAPLQGVACLVAPRAYLGWWIVLGYDGP